MARVSFTVLGLIALTGCASPMPQGMPFISTSANSAPLEVTKDDIVPYGTFARNCTISASEMGTEVKNISGYQFFDSEPEGTRNRTMFLTGFRDRCARQFTGALVMFGDVGTHEVVRYSEIGLKRPYSATDEAYEVIKATYCGARRTKPCGRRIDSLAKSTSFVTVYDGFSDNAAWLDMLMHKGEIIAVEINDG